MASGPIIVCVLSHTDPPMLNRLTDSVLEGQDVNVLVHHDPRGPRHDLRESERLRLIPDPQPCHWGRMGLPEAAIRCLRTSFDLWPDWQWFLLVSGQDYPAQPIRETERVLAAEPNDALLRHFIVDRRDPSQDVDRWQATGRRRYFHRRRLPGSSRSIPMSRTGPFTEDGPSLFIGGFWFNVNRRAGMHILAQYERMREVRRFLSGSPIPDEALVPTLLLNDAEGLSVLNDRKRYIKWAPQGGQPHPEFLTTSDLDAITASNAFFCRKTSTAASSALLDALDLVHRTA